MPWLSAAGLGCPAALNRLSGGRLPGQGTAGGSAERP
jgi:hypothetical protein